MRLDLGPAGCARSAGNPDDIGQGRPIRARGQTDDMIVMIPVTPVNRGVGIHVRQLTLIIAVLMQHDVVMAVMRNEQCLMPAVARRPQNRARELRKDEQMPDSAHGGHQTADNWIPEKLHRGLRR